MDEREIKEAIKRETARLVSTGMPEFIASIRAAGKVQNDIKEAAVARKAALATHCTDS